MKVNHITNLNFLYFLYEFALIYFFLFSAVKKSLKSHLDKTNFKKYIKTVFDTRYFLLKWHFQKVKS